MTVVRLMTAIRDEYTQWPTLRLTPAQVGRLWTTEAGTSTAALRALVSAGVLSELEDGSFVRAADARRDLDAGNSRSGRDAILCAVDFDPVDQERLSAASRGALREAFVLARESGSRVVVLHVLPPVPAHLVFSAGEAARVAGAQRVQAAEARERLRAAAARGRWPREVELRVEYGSPHDEIIRTAERVRASTIVLGRPRRGPVVDALLGSTFHRVLGRAPCAVLVAGAPTPRAA